MVSPDLDPGFQQISDFTGGIMADSLENLTREELMNLANDRGIKGYRWLKKNDLILHLRGTSTRLPWYLFFFIPIQICIWLAKWIGIPCLFVILLPIKLRRGKMWFWKKDGEKQTTGTKTKLRSKPIKNLCEEDVETILKNNNFFCSYKNPSASGFSNDFVIESNGKVICDRATGLRWQQFGLENEMTDEEAKDYVAHLNRDQFAGYSDWRLPTLEEAMSLVKSTRNGDYLYIDPVFDKQERWVWTSDTYRATSAWVVIFYSGNCNSVDFDCNVYVRAVR